MNSSKLSAGLLCLMTAASLATVAMTQDARDEPRSRLPAIEASDPEVPAAKVLPPMDSRDDSPSFFQPPPAQTPRATVPPLVDDFAPRDDRRFDDERESFSPPDRFLTPDEERGFGSLDNRSGRRQQQPQMRPRQITRTVVETMYEAVPLEEIAETAQLREAIQLLKVSTDDAEKKKAADTIQAQLKKQFIRDLKQREEELEKVEERVRSLRKQLDKRKAAQDDIISLRLQTLVNEASGLGFPATNFGPPVNRNEANPFGRAFAPSDNAPAYAPAGGGDSYYDPNGLEPDSSLNPPMRQPDFESHDEFRAQ